MAFYIKQNDTEPTFQAGLLDSDGFPVDLTSATAVRFHMRDASGTVIVDQPMVIITAASGVVQYDWIAADTQTAGSFQVEVEVTYLGGSIETFPNNGYEEVIITDDIA